MVGGAWPLLVTLTPAADRPWISGTADNSIWSLIFGYNGLGRISGQTGGPSGGAGAGGSLFGGPTGVFRLLQTGLGDQAGWLLGFAVVSGIALVVLTRLRRNDPQTGFVIVLGGTLLTVGFVFSFASGIFHPYYVSMIAPWAAALIGAGVGEMAPPPVGVSRSRRSARILGPAALIGGAITELVILGEIGGQLGWARPLVIAAAAAGAALLALALAPRIRIAVLSMALVGLLAAPATWAAETVTYATSGTFPTGGPSSAAVGAPGGAVGGLAPPGGAVGGTGRGFGAAGARFGGSAGGVRPGVAAARLGSPLAAFARARGGAVAGFAGWRRRAGGAGGVRQAAQAAQAAPVAYGGRRRRRRLAA